MKKRAQLKFRAEKWPADEASRDQLTRRALEDARSDSLPKFLPDHALAHLATAVEKFVAATSAAVTGPVTPDTLPRVRRVAGVLARLKTMGLKLPEAPE